MGSVQSNDKTPKTPSASSAQSPENTEAAASSSPGDSPVVETYPQTEVTEAPASPPCPSGDKSAAETEVVQVSEEQLAEIAQATKSLMEKPSGKSMEIVLSPAVKKQKSRVSPPTSPTSNVTQESIVQKLKDAEERRQSIESAKLKKIKEHQEHGDWVRNINNPEEKEKAYVMELQINIKAKEERARELKEKKDAELREKRAEQNKKAELVRQKKEKLLLEGGDQTNESA